MKTDILAYERKLLAESGVTFDAAIEYAKKRAAMGLRPFYVSEIFQMVPGGGLNRRALMDAFRAVYFNEPWLSAKGKRRRR